ncbi:serine/threonine protein kinase [Actinacidiphila yanglinensis]|uniref:Serine/threonine protein kinase n=1 Tax=Actinacidiphila yanglinensis TaxID=310779 RepID=A0A1H5SJB1_9ACTN|nr:class III lanthionine synthetase LanKC [Actinacidiphila yanglinensis]SEF50530.1 serine/threonine protein kinase [Actinacidiphila yanglinensis]
MDNRYEVFCLADRHFYESLDRLSATRGPGSGDGTGGADGQRYGDGAEAGDAGGPDTAAVPLFDTARRPAPDGWRTVRSGDWLHVDPPAGTRTYPGQGWKVHASATLDNADKIAAKVWDYCVPRHIPFKFVPGPHLLHLRNSKYAGRDTSGKFVTIYPPDEGRLRVVLDELGALLDGEQGPYILTDLRWGQGPLYVRYGAFAKRYCVGGRGTLVPAVEDGDGQLVPDDRSPAFHVPGWVTLPDFLAPHLAARNATTVSDLPYRIEKALHFSNGGGVYAGTDTRSGEKVVLKEGRPHAGLASDGADAVTRLRRERDALRRLSGLGVAPEMRDWFTVGDHRFLVMDFVEGKPLNSYFGHRHPLLRPDPDPAEVADYTRWALRINAGVEEAVAAVHSRGLVFNDLHMFNIMVGPDDETVSLLDFEAAARATDNGRQAVAHPGFLAPPDRRGTAVDHYALACLRLALFLPVTTLFAVDRAKAAHLAEVIAREFPVPETYLEEAVAEITRTAGDTAAAGGSSGRASIGPVAPAVGGATGGPGLNGTSLHAGSPSDDLHVQAAVAEPAPGEGGSTGGAPPAAVVGLPAGTRPGPPRRYLPAEPRDWPAARASMAQAILGSATPDREDRLFPGDIAQFSDGGGLGLAHGAAGVLHAFDQVGLPRYDEGEQWLLERTANLPNGTPPGLYDGVAGVAYVLDRLGHTERALALVHGLLDENWRRLASDLTGGLAGIALVLDHLAQVSGETALRERALEAAGIIAGRLAAEIQQVRQSEDGGPSAGAPRRAGLMRGATGPALLFLRLYERTGAPALLEHAARALTLDLDSCTITGSGSLEVDERWRTMPYVGDGSAGIGLVLDDLLGLAGTGDLDEPSVARFEHARTGIVRAATARLYAQPGLFAGRAGMILHLARTTAPAVPDGALRAQIDALGWYGMAYRGDLAFPGNQMMRLSMDLGTGTAGCLLALGAANAGQGPTPRLPFLPPPPAS